MFISRQFSSSAVKIDTAVFNPARISRLPFIMNRKGKSTAERPHRMATVLSYPEQVTALTVEMIRPFYASCGLDKAPRQKRRQSELVIDEDGVLDLIAEYPDQLEHSGQTTEDGDSTWLALDSCPFAGRPHRGQHVGKGKTCLVWSPDNLGFKCFSDDCAGLGIGDLLRHLHERQAIGQRLRFGSVTRSGTTPRSLPPRTSGVASMSLTTAAPARSRTKLSRRSLLSPAAPAPPSPTAAPTR